MWAMMIAMTVGFPRSLNPSGGFGDLLPSEVRLVGTRIDLCIRGAAGIASMTPANRSRGSVRWRRATACTRARERACANHAIHGVVFGVGLL